MEKRNTEPRAALFPTIPISSKDFGNMSAVVNIGTSDQRVVTAPGLERQNPTRPTVTQKTRRA